MVRMDKAAVIIDLKLSQISDFEISDLSNWQCSLGKRR